MSGFDGPLLAKPSMKEQRLLISQLAGLEYSGSSGVTADCIRAIARLIYSGELIKEALLLSCQQFHAFVLFGQFDDVFVIKNGFSSGYSGEGPAGLSTALQMLARHNVEVEEYDVDQKTMDRLAQSCLLESDLELLRKARPIRPKRLADYQDWSGEGRHQNRPYLDYSLPNAIPFGIIDNRIVDLAVAFYEDTDRALVTAYRRLEDIVRARVDSTESSSKLFSKAFLQEDSPLTWKMKDISEAKSRASMFTSVFGAFRNARMHREQNQTREDALREFLLVNELFVLESRAITRELESDHISKK